MIIHTDCRDCCFAIFDDNVQTDCGLGKLKQHLEVGNAVTPSAIHEDFKQGFIIHGICPFKRTEEWKNQQTTDDYESAIFAENKLRYHIIIKCHKNLAKTTKYISQLNDLNPMPSFITLVVSNEVDSAYRTSLCQFCQSTLLTEWEINIPLTNINKVIEWRESIYQIIQKNNYPFFSIFRIPFNIPKNLFNTINKKIHDELWKFVAILPNTEKDSQINGLIMNRNVYQTYVYWSSNAPIIKNIKAKANPSLLFYYKDFAEQLAIK